MPKSHNGRTPIASVQRALDILNLFNASRPELRNVEIAELLGIPAPTAAGLIYTLRINNYLDQNPENRKYHLGLKLAERATTLLEQIDIRKIANPYLENLRDFCGESVNLAIRDGKEVVYIERMFGHHSLGIRSELGKRGFLHSTSLGKAILSNLPSQEIEDILRTYQLISITPKTITDLQRFREELEIIKKRGYAIDEEENELGGRCVGAPIFGHKKYAIAAISVSVPIQRFPDERVKEIGEKLMEIAFAISKKMGYLNGI